MNQVSNAPLETELRVSSKTATRDISWRIFYLFAALIIVCYLTLAFGHAFAAVPWCDEAWLSNPALTFLRHGYLGTPILTPFSWGPPQYLPHIEHRTYWIMPLHMLTQVGWYKLFGFSLLALRSLSIFWGAVMITLIGWIAQLLGFGRAAALASMAAAATDYYFLTRAADGRMDVMAGALMLSSLAVYLWQRSRNLDKAIFLAGIFAACSAFTHPVGGFFSICGLAVLALRYDRKRLRFVHAIWFGIPSLAIGACWGLYAAQDFAAFRAQLAGNAHGRWEGVSNLYWSVYRELRFKYFQAFGLNSWERLSLHNLRMLALALYIGSLFVAGFNRKLRNLPGAKALVWLSVVFIFGGMAFDGAKRWYYIVHVFPLFALAFGVAAVTLWQEKPAWRKVFIAGIIVFFGIQTGGTLVRIRRNDYKNEYLKVARFVQAEDPEHASIIGSGELGFALGFPEYFIDDLSLGYYSGAHPKLIFAPRTYWQLWLDDITIRKPEVGRFVQQTLRSEYRTVYLSPLYKVYERKQYLAR
jgi:4-amino-4-deoxy-L-arabinose transferase-like glycosyltransferase